MAIKGVNPSYFAGMPEVALDPKASKANPQYAQMLSQAMQNQATATDRRRESDEDNAFKARSQTETERSNRSHEDISKRNTAVGEAGEARLKSGQEFSQDRLKSADTRDLIEAAHRAKESKDQVAYDFLNSELEKRGVTVRSKQNSVEDFEKQDSRAAPAAPPAAPPVDRSPVPPRSPPPTAGFPPAAEAEAAPPMRAAPAGPLPRSTASFPPTNGAPPPGAAPAPPPTGPRPGIVTSPTEGIPFINKTQNMDWIEGKQPPLAAPARPPAPARPMASDDEQFYRDMDWHPPTEKELLDRAIAEAVQRESGALAAPPTVAPPVPTRPLLPGKSLRAQ